MDQRGLDDGLLVNRAYSGHGLSKQGHQKDSRQQKATSKSRWPHTLNVVTNFSKPAQLAQKAADTARRPEEDVVEAFRRGHRRLNSSTDIKTPDGYIRRNVPGQSSQASVDDPHQAAAVGLGFHKFENTRKAPSPPRDKGPIFNLRRASSKITTLSPSDRPIVIGISVPSDKLEQHTVSPAVGPTPISISSQQFGRVRRPSDTPSIMVTPAIVERSGSTELETPIERARRRIPSSVYSRATNARGTPKQINIPPMPTAVRRSLSLSNNFEPSRPPNTFSTYTMFDEEDSPKEDTYTRRFSGESQLRVLKRSSTDSVATKHRSQGWWNHIVSPFLPRPGSVPWRSGSRDNEPIPDLPLLANTSPFTNRDLPAEDRTPPMPTKPRRSSSDGTSIFTDTSSVDIEKQPADTMMLHSPFHESPRDLDYGDKDLSDWFAGLGAAAEYYHACWHDQKYPTPYFDCQNHVCVPRRLGGFPIAQNLHKDHKGLPEGPREVSGNDVPQDSKPGPPDGFQQTPANRFDAAFQEAVNSDRKDKERPFSEVTVIEDVDATPIVQEAKAAPVVRAPPPVLAAQSLPPEPNPQVGAETTKDIPTSSIPPRKDSKQPPPAVLSSPLATPAVAAPKDIPQEVEHSEPTEAPVQRPPVSLPSNPRAEKPAKRFVAVMPPGYPPATRIPPMSPGAASPNTLPKDGYPMDELSKNPSVPSGAGPNAIPTTIINHYHYNPTQSAMMKSDHTKNHQSWPAPSPMKIKEYNEKEKRASKDYTEKNRSCTPKLTNYFNRGRPKTKKQKWVLIGITSGLIAMIILIVLLATLLVRKGDEMEVQSQWLNLTGFPPIPTGVSTIIQPDLVQASSGCIRPGSLWSCAVPKEEQLSIAPNAPDQPNFRIEIRFQNSSIAHEVPSNDTSLARRSHLYSGNAVTAGGLVRSHLLRIRDLTSNLFTPSPSPPSREDQIFLGNTTDKNQQPFDGTATPFFISFINPERLSSPSRMVKRAPAEEDRDTTANNTNFPDLASSIPEPSTDTDGKASPAILYPLSTAQPLRLYDRDRATEHYGFYIYFDRSIFLQSAALLNFTNGSPPSEIPADENGGAEANDARVRCTWAQTRFLVQIWTRKGIAASLLKSSNSSDSDSDSSPGSKPKDLTSSSANEFTRPGSFPYPVSITLDRHGGDIKKKMVYCYGMDGQQRIVDDEKQIQLEDRAAGAGAEGAGGLVNPALGPFGEVKVSGDEGGPGGIDGGVGGCGCRWDNFGGGEGEGGSRG
ncbi:MAG: hypothetical protein Q9169_005917 [Polycauliona sp. 2 TL-2023]